MNDAADSGRLSGAARRPGAGPSGQRPGWRALLAAPNLISLGRIPLAAAYLLIEQRPARVAILSAAAATDFLDGWIARRFGVGSRLGELLDPVTDKLFVATVVGVQIASGALPLWQAGLLLLRDGYTVIAGLATSVLRWPVRFKARMSGKVVTNLQILTMLILTIAPEFAVWAVFATAAAGVWSIADYTVAALRGLRRDGSSV